MRTATSRESRGDGGKPSLEELKRAAAGCRACDLCERATEMRAFVDDLLVVARLLA